MDNELMQQGLLGFGSVGNFVYLHMPAVKVRHLVDSAFPSFAKCAAADVVSGNGHRWVAGHDLLLDVPKTISSDGILAGTKHALHILLTDFPTKAGIPIPGLSKSGLGEYLVNHWHIPSGYLSINAVDGVVGIFACTEGFLDLLSVSAEPVRMTPQLFFDTFVQGCAELAIGTAPSVQNPLLFLAGLEQISAGAVSTVYTVTHPEWFVDPSVFFGTSLTSGVIGFALSKFVFHRTPTESLVNAGRSCAVSGLFVVNAGFGIAALCGFVGMGLGRMIAARDNANLAASFRISKSELEIIVEGYAMAYPRLYDQKDKWKDLANGGISFETTFGLKSADGRWPLEFSDSGLALCGLSLS